MASVFFNINPTQEKEVKRLMKEEGYTNKAEFFRFLIKYYKYNKAPEKSVDELRFEKAAKELGDTLRKLDKQGKIENISLEEQLKDV